MRWSTTHRCPPSQRRGAVLILVALLMVFLAGMLAFAIDLGYVMVARTHLQRAADAAALAAVVELIPSANGYQDLQAVRAAVQSYADLNVVLGKSGSTTFQVAESDIEIGRYDSNAIYLGNPLSLQMTGTADAVRVTLRLDGQTNRSLGLFFAPAMGIGTASVQATATAVLRRADPTLKVGADVLPFAFHIDTWNAFNEGDQFSIYGDQRVENNLGVRVPGNWGTVDIGNTNNSVADIRDQILNGLRQTDLDSLATQTGRDGLPRIPDNTELPVPVWFQADAGLSTGMKHAVLQIHGQTRLIPLYDGVNGDLTGDEGGKDKDKDKGNDKNNGADGEGGNNAEFHVVAWGVITVVTSNWGGANNTYLTVQRSYTYDGALAPCMDLSDSSNTIDGAYTSPALVE